MKNNSWFDIPDDTSSGSRCQAVCSSMSPRARSVLSKAVWVIATARNAVIVIVCALMAYGFDPVLPSGDVDKDMIEPGSYSVAEQSSLNVPDENFHSNSHYLPSVSHNTTFILTGNIQRGLPAFQYPPFSVNVTAGNSTHPTYQIIGVSGMISELGSAIIIIPLLIILENVAIAKAFGKFSNNRTGRGQSSHNTLRHITFLQLRRVAIFCLSWWKTC